MSTRNAIIVILSMLYLLSLNQLGIMIYELSTISFILIPIVISCRMSVCMGISGKKDISWMNPKHALVGASIFFDPIVMLTLTPMGATTKVLGDAVAGGYYHIFLPFIIILSMSTSLVIVMSGGWSKMKLGRNDFEVEGLNKF